MPGRKLCQRGLPSPPGALSLSTPAVDAPGGWAILVVAGLLVGFGTRLANGCTSGHGVCGLSRLSARSVVATAIFVGSGMVTVALLRLAGSGA